MGMKNTKNERELLRQQMELLAKQSKHCKVGELPGFSMAMIEIYKTLYWQPSQARLDIANE